jgi:hypothetical protein
MWQLRSNYVTQVYKGDGLGRHEENEGTTTVNQVLAKLSQRSTPSDKDEGRAPRKQLRAVQTRQGQKVTVSVVWSCFGASPGVARW